MLGTEWMERAAEYIWRSELSDVLYGVWMLILSLAFLIPYPITLDTSEELVKLPETIEELFAMDPRDFLALAIANDGIPDELLETMLDAAGSEDASIRLQSYGFLVILHKNKLGVTDEMMLQYARTARSAADTPHERRVWIDIERRLIHP